MSLPTYAHLAPDGRAAQCDSRSPTGRRCLLLAGHPCSHTASNRPHGEIIEWTDPPDDGFDAEVAAQREQAEAEYARKRERQEGHRYGLLGADSFRWPDDD